MLGTLMTPDEKFWLSEARRVSLLVNAQSWFERSLPWLAGVHVCAAIAILGSHRSNASVSPSIALIIAIAWCLVWCVVLIRLWRSRLRPTDALARLEVHHQLHGQLSSAWLGKADWPRARGRRFPYRYHFQSNQALLAASILLPLIAGWIPIKQAQGEVLPPSELPPDLLAIENTLESLEAEPRIDAASLETFQEQLDQLKGDDPSDWYDQSSLEAADALKSELEHQLSSLSQALSDAEKALSELERMGDDMRMQPESARNQAAEALNRLSDESLAFQEPLLQQLQEALENPAASLSPDQMEQLRESMRDTRETAQSLSNIGRLQQLSQEQLQEIMEGMQPGQSGSGNKGDGQSSSTGEGMQEGTGLGGVNRGPGDAPLLFNVDGLPFVPETFEGISNSDMSTASPGETLQTVITRPDPNADEPVDDSILEGGPSGTASAGGTATWQQILTPQEKERLERFFDRSERN